MAGVGLVEQARKLAGLSRAELARRASTSRPTLAAYAAGSKVPTLATAERIIGAAGFTLELAPVVTFADKPVGRGRYIPVPSLLPRLPLAQAFARVVLPLHLNWSEPGRVFDLSDRAQRARVYEIVLREGAAEDILRYVDGALLKEIWAELVLPREVWHAWNPVVSGVPAEVP